ncbi:MAG: four helix bundle protein [Candidatus Omnitrophica bacterium]|nr:four helix bundle protein [Candidatus Omnitrophota bacterium]
MDEPNYRKLLVWQKAHKNALLIIDLLNKCNSKYSRILIQCVSSATSIGANIAEGNSTRTNKEKQRYFEIALNSSYEFDNWLQVLKDSKVICFDKKSLSIIEKQNIEVIKVLNRLISNLNS